MGVKILSLFDGMACGMIAMQLAGVEVESYDAYEIDKYAIKTAQHNFPMIKEHGDVFEADFTQYEGVDFLIGGSPCTYWSIAQTKNRETVASGMGWELFSQYVRALHEAKPKYFIYENNKSMSKQIRASIDKAFGFEAVLINSALVSAQNRQRLYWVGKRNADGTYSRVNVEQPADRRILLKDVLDSAVARDMAAEPINTDANEKAFCVTSRYYKGFGNNPGKCLEKHRDSMAAEPVDVFNSATVRRAAEDIATKKGYIPKMWCPYNRTEIIDKSPTLSTGSMVTSSCATIVAEPVCVAERGRMYCGQPQHYEARTDGKTNTLTSVEKDNRVAEPISYCTDKNVEHLMRNFGSKGKIVDEESKTPTLMAAAGMGGGNHIYYADSIAEPINVTADGKAQCLRATCYKDGIRNIIANEVDKKTGVAEPINVTADDKSHTLKAQYYKNGIANFISNDGFDATAVAESVLDICQVGAMPRPDGELSTSAGFRVYSVEAKGRYLCANGGGAGAKTGLYAIPYAIEFDDEGRPIKAIGKDGKEITIYEVRDGKITIKGKQYPIKLKDGFYIIRKLTVSECKRLQTVPEWYEFPVSNSQAYKMLGNGWTCEVIAHLIRSCMAEQWGGVDG